ncbi:hypothetical protein ACNOYE_00425 [Nannocystaceae bacterium ST9]
MDMAPKSSSGPGRLSIALAFAFAFSVGCFNSDEKVRASDEAGTGSTDTGAIYSDETAQETDDNWTASTETGDTTCRDAIDCLIDCQYELIGNMDPEPDLSCFLECDKGLTVEEALALLKLGECIAGQCLEIGECAGSQDTTDGTSSDSTDGTGSDSGTDTGPTDTDCLLCIAAYAMDPEPPGCMELAAECD